MNLRGENQIVQKGKKLWKQGTQADVARELPDSLPQVRETSERM